MRLAIKQVGNKEGAKEGIHNFVGGLTFKDLEQKLVKKGYCFDVTLLGTRPQKRRYFIEAPSGIPKDRIIFDLTEGRE